MARRRRNGGRQTRTLRQRLQRSGRLLASILTLAVATTATVYLGNLLWTLEIPEILPVEQVEVTGDLRFVKPDEVRQIIVDNLDGGYFTLDLAHIRAQLLQQPWIREVAIRRQWPASLQVSIEEQQPVAYWNRDAYINRRGEIFTPQRLDRHLGLPELNGPQGMQETVWKFMNRLYREMALLDYEVVRLDLDTRRAWQLQVAAPAQSDRPAVTVRLGRFDTEKRLQRFIRVLPALMRRDQARRRIAYIDMRYPNGFAIGTAPGDDETQTNSLTAPGLVPVANNHDSRIADSGQTGVVQKGEA